MIKFDEKALKCSITWLRVGYEVWIYFIGEAFYVSQKTDQHADNTVGTVVGGIGGQ